MPDRLSLSEMSARAPAHRPAKVTHGRHCTCSSCAREDWTNPDLAPCGMHGKDCPNRYQPLGPAGMRLGGTCAICGDDEPFHVHNQGERIEDYFTVGRGQTDFEAAQAWRTRALAAESELERVISGG